MRDDEFEKSLHERLEIAEKEKNIAVSESIKTLEKERDSLANEIKNKDTSRKFKTAIDEIDKTITHLQKTKNALLSSENNLRLANNKEENLHQYKHK